MPFPLAFGREENGVSWYDGFTGRLDIPSGFEDIAGIGAAEVSCQIQFQIEGGH